MKKSLHRIVALSLLGGVLALVAVLGRTPVHAQVADASGAKSGDMTEALLREAKLDFKRPKDNVFRVLIEAKGEITPVIVEEKKTPWKDSKGGDVLYAFIWCEVLPLPNDFRPPTAMLMRMAEMNDSCRFGSISLGKNSNGGLSVFRNMSCFLRGTNAEQLTDYLYVSHFERLSVRKALQGYLEESR